MALELWTPHELYELRQDERNTPLPSYFLDTFFTNTYFSEDQEIRFADLPEADRYLAPFVLPYEQGKPLMFSTKEDIKSFAPPYIKLKNAVRPTQAKSLRPSDVFRNGGNPPSLEERFNARVAELTEKQVRAIRMREVWMAARAFIDGQVVISYDRDQGADSPVVTLSFGRDAGHTVTKSSNYWSDPNTDILGDIETWMNTMYLAYGGGSAAMLIVGAQVALLFRRNVGVKAALDKNYRGNESVSIDLGIMRTDRPLNYIGELANGLSVWSYKDTVDVPNGSGGKTRVDILHEKDVLLVAPGATGVRAYGAIYDVDAIDSGAALSTDIFGKMFDTKDPGERFVMHQSSPLPIPLYPNRTFKARVLA